ncbi:MAG TPA: TetR/AcrR family transcriptional regulator [Bacteroidales bacterium]|nr:TetR/AcrR family transcriptional regulator [Bacteroidales bacterium]HRZ75933.1 TetR/AcrR family transcriptional regulator [Bacteroidales bacterium]
MDERFTDILTRAWEVFQRYGIRSVSMDDLSTRLGISKKTLYTFVNNKTELVEQTLYYQLAYARSMIKDCPRPPENAIGFLLEMSRAVCAQLSATHPALLYDLRKYYPEVLEKFVAMHRSFYSEVFSRNLEEGIAQGMYRQDIDKDLTIKLYLHNIEHFFGEEIASGQSVSSTQMFRVLFGNHIRSIASPEGLAYFESKELDYTL